VTAWEVFELISTQPRTGGMGGFLGFDYSALPVILDSKRIPKYEWPFILDKLNIISNIAVRFWNKNNDTAKKDKK
jgi:hypothetical protein